MVSFKENLDSLEDIKNRMKNKLIEYGVDEPTDVLSNYADKIKEVKNELMREVTSEIVLPAVTNRGDICYGNDKFFIACPVAPGMAAPGYFGMMYSKDGISWDTAQCAGKVYNSISLCYGNGIFVFISDLGFIGYSEDGLNWNPVTSVSEGEYHIAYGNGKFVAVNGNSNLAFYSTDGTTWIQISMPTNEYGWADICYGNGIFLATSVVNSTTIAYSTDGINWTTSNLPTDNSWMSIAYGNGMFVVFEYDSGANLIVYSTDGINWEQESFCGIARPKSTYGNGKFVVIDSDFNSDISAYSADGINWTRGTLPTSDVWTDVCYGNNKFIAITETEIFAYSLDGITWTNTKTEKLPLYELNGTSYIHYNPTDTVIPSCFVKSVNGYQRNWVDNVEFNYTGTDINKDNFEFYCYDGTLYIIATMPSSTYLREPTLKYSPNVTYVNGTQYQDTYGKIGVYKFTVTPNIPVNVYITMTVSSTSRYWDLTIDY